MSVKSIRFRTEGDLVVLQVLVSKPRFAYEAYNLAGEWRDAQVTDLLEVAKFTRERAEGQDKWDGAQP